MYVKRRDSTGSMVPFGQNSNESTVGKVAGRMTAAIGKVVEFDHAEFDDLVLSLIEAGRLHVEQDAGLGALAGGSARSDLPGAEP